MKVFVSHSSRTDSFADNVLDAVRHGLAAQDLFVDCDVLRPGDEWRTVLYHWLAECHAAVVLLNREALASSWVRREVNILLWRRALGYPLTIVPTMLGDLSTRDLKDAGLGDLAELQIARLTPAERTPDAARRLAATIAGILGEAPALPEDDSRMADWGRAIADSLEQVRYKDRLVDAARLLGVEEGDLGRVRDPIEGYRFLAHRFLARWHGKSLSLAIEKVANFTPVEALSKLIAKVSATWVDGEAARVLLTYNAGRPGTVLLNAHYQISARHYVDRATESVNLNEAPSRGSY